VEGVGRRKIGILGGTFDPPHNGHLQLATAAMREIGLEQVIFVPSGSPPHKNRAAISSFKHRLAMIELATRNNPAFECSAVEQELSPPTYTVDMLSVLKKSDHHSNNSLYFLMGSDAFLDILSWKEYRRLIQEVHVVLAMREGDNREDVDRLLGKLGIVCVDSESVIDGRKKENGLRILSGRIDKISSTSIRTRINQGKSIYDLVPLDVMKYIIKNGLYRETTNQ